MGTARHLIVTVEQVSKSPEGHLSRLALLVRNKAFQKHLVWVNVDETHHIHTAGQALYGLKAFRPAWGQLDELKILLPRKVRFHGYSATLPDHILLLVQQKIMKPNHTLIRVTSNRPNTTYATHQVVNNLEDLQNYECFLATLFSLASQPHVIIFVDDKDLTSKIARHLESCLPSTFCGQGIVRHYHSGMSELYLSRVHESFTSEEGTCRILVATSGQSVVSCLHLFNIEYFTHFIVSIRA